MSRALSRNTKAAANLSIDRDLLKAARESGVNPSAALEEVLIEKVATAGQEAWVRENAGAIAGYNEFVEEHGMFSEDARSF